MPEWSLWIVEKKDICFNQCYKLLQCLWSSDSALPHFQPALSFVFLPFPQETGCRTWSRDEALPQSTVLEAVLSAVPLEKWGRAEIFNTKLIKPEPAASSKTWMICSSLRRVHLTMIKPGDYCICQSLCQEQQHNSYVREAVRGEVTSYFQIRRKKTFKMFVLELFFWLMFNLSFFQSNVLVISSIAEGHI